MQQKERKKETVIWHQYFVLGIDHQISFCTLIMVVLRHRSAEWKTLSNHSCDTALDNCLSTQASAFIKQFWPYKLECFIYFPLFCLVFCENPNN